MADDTLIVYDPTASPRIIGAELAARPDALAGRTVGILDNGKANAGLLMGAVVDLLRERHGVADVIVRKKPVAGPAPARAVEDLVRECAAVLVGSAD